MAARFKAVIFDLDGTLLNTIDDISDAMNRVFDTHGLPRHTAEVYKTFIGDGIFEFVKDALPPQHRDPAFIERCIAEMRAEYARCWHVQTRPYSGIPELLDALRKLGLRIGVLSNKPHDFTQMMVRELLPRWPFHPVMGARDTVPRKPDPAGALEVAELLSLAPPDCMYVGDSENDVLTATRAGMIPVAVTWGFRSLDQLRRTGAEYIIHHPLELIQYIR